MSWGNKQGPKGSLKFRFWSKLFSSHPYWLRETRKYLNDFAMWKLHFLCQHSTPLSWPPHRPHRQQQAWNFRYLNVCSPSKTTVGVGSFLHCMPRTCMSCHFEKHKRHDDHKGAARLVVSVIIVHQTCGFSPTCGDV